MKQLLIAFLLVFALAGGAVAQDDEESPVVFRNAPPDPSLVTLTPVVDGLNNPLYVTAAPDDDRVFILEQAGRILILQDGEFLPTPFADLSDRVSQDVLRGYSERGLLGLAFSPNYAEDGRFYVNYTDQNGTTQLARMTVTEDDPNVANTADAEIIFTLDQPFANHNGGHLDFGPDGFLYMSIGDGGAANDPLSTGQDPSDYYGSLIRIDVDTETGYQVPADNPAATNEDFAPEVWNYGLRNVWRFSFDRATGDMYLADVGQNRWEEVNFQLAESPGGENYGWNDYEASYPFAANTAPENMVYPFAEYEHTNGNISVTGGYVYRGEAIPDLQGVYFYGDYGSGRVWAAWRDEMGTWNSEEFLSLGTQLSSFGEDAAGELYVVDYRGSVLRFDATE